MASTRGRKRPRAASIATHPGPDQESLPLHFEDEPNHSTASRLLIPACENEEPGEPRRYSTRRSTQVARPGVAAGLAKRHKSDIQAEAAKKKEEELTKRDKKERRERAKAAHELEATKKVAAMLDERARRELEDMDEMDRTPEFEHEGTDAPARDAGTIADERANGGQQRSNHLNIRVDLDDDSLSDGLQRGHPSRHSPTSPISLSSYHPEGSDSSPSDSDDTIAEQPAQHAETPVARNKGKGTLGSKPAQRKQKKNHNVSTTHDFGPVAPPKKKLTETERRAARIEKLRGGITERRETVPNQTARVESADKSSQAPRPAPTSRGKAGDKDAFTADYRSRARTASATPASKKAPTSGSADLVLTFIGDKRTSSHTGVAPSTQDQWAASTFNFISDTPTPSSSAATARRTEDPAPLSDEDIGGLDDGDASTPVPTRVHKRSVPPARSATKNMMVGIMASSVIEGDEVVDPPKKRTRAPRTKLSMQQSRGLPALLVWIQASMISVIIPSLIKHFGALDNPWDDDQFEAIFNALMKKLHPDRDAIVQGTKEWRYARQGVYDWRSNFGKLAIKLVTKAAKRLGSTTAIGVWAHNALAKGGEATYSQPNTVSHEDARGALHTPLHIQLLASHYSAAEGAIIATSYPVGALSLANVAIRRAFTAFKTGVFIAQDDFTDSKYGEATTKSRRGAVKGLEDIPHRFDGLIAMAMAQLPSFKRAEAEHAEQAADDEDAYAAVDPPTSPPAADQY